MSRQRRKGPAAQAMGWGLDVMMVSSFIAAERKTEYMAIDQHSLVNVSVEEWGHSSLTAFTFLFIYRQIGSTVIS